MPGFLKTTAILVLGVATATAGDWLMLFDGTSMEGWSSNNETEEVFTIDPDGSLKVEGGRAHLFWMGTATIPGSFTNFQFKAQVKTMPGSNSGIFFHTQYQENGWPSHGYEAQINTTNKDRRKTGSIYAVSDILDDAPSKDGQWFDYEIRVQGKAISILVDGNMVNEYTEPDDLPMEGISGTRRISSGTFALQGHDPKSTIFYRNIRVRIL